MGVVQDLTTRVIWSSGNNSIAQVSNTSGSLGLVTGLSGGDTPIVATFKGIQGSTTVKVTTATLTSITITPDPSIAKGTAEQLTATCNFNDGTTEDCTNEASWTSGDSGIGQVSDKAQTKGLVTGVGVGSTSIIATFGGIHGTVKFSATPATLSSITNYSARCFDREGHHAAAHRHGQLHRRDYPGCYHSGELDLGQQRARASQPLR
jgi:hypothetical protein